MAVPKTTPLLDELRVISTAQREEFRENGHIHVRGLVSPAELAVYRPLIVDLVRRHRSERRRPFEKEYGGRASVMNLWRSDEAIRRLVLSRRLGKVAADLLGVENVRIYHDQAIFREPGAGLLPWRQDQFYRPLDTASTITLWMPLTDVSLEMGMLTFAAGSHKNGLAPDQRPADESENRLRKYIKDHQFPITRAAGMRAGDGSWHCGNTLYSIPANNSDRTQEMMTVIYMADGARVVQAAHERQAEEWNNWLMSLPPGRLAASELNPLVL
jgi:ectoine hydroxylase-related dioxygenase (phytanoyl-CoA dioxygenase family)